MFLGREVSRSQNYSEQTAQAIDREVSDLLAAAYSRAKNLITANMERVTTIADMLLERETLDGADVEDIIEHGRILSAAERPLERLAKATLRRG